MVVHSRLESAEDASDYATISYVDRLLTETREEIGRADQKAAILLAATGVAVTVLVGLLAGRWSPAHLPAGIQWLWWLGVLALAAAIVFLAAAVMPRISHRGDPSTVTYFGHVVRLTDRSRLIEHLRRSAANPLDRAVDQLVLLSRIAFRKYRCTQVAMWLLGSAAVAMVICDAIGTFTS